MSPAQLVYFFVYSIYGAILPFLPIVFHSKGLSDVHCQFVLSAYGLAAIVSPILAGYFADRHWDARRIIRVVLGAAILIAPCWLAVSDLQGLAVVTLLFAIFYVPAISILDAHTLNCLGEGSRTEFQNIRVLGSIGFILPSVICAVIQPSPSVLQIFVVSWVVFSGIVAIVLTKRLLPSPIKTYAKSNPSLQAYKATLRAPIFGLLWPVTLAGFGMGMFFNLYPRLLQEIGVVPGMIGLIFSFGVVIEIVCMPFTAKLIARFGAERLVAVAIAAVMVRVFCLGVSDSLLLAVLTQLLHGPIVVGMLVVLPILLRERSAPETRYSIQGIFTQLFMGVARTLGPWIAALFLAATGVAALQGIHHVFLFAAALSAVSLIWFLIANRPQSQHK